MVSVRDNGVGIAAEMLSRVFEMFTQVGGAHERVQGGLGIGLTLALKLVEMHGGRIEAKSSGLGQGSEFVVRLPLARAGRPISAAPHRLPCDRAALPAHRILVVDDARATVYTLGKLLESLGQQVFTALDAASALERAKSNRPQMVISDIGMPNVDGYELARRLRKEPGLAGIVLVALTGYGQDNDRRRTKEAGFDCHLVKPVSLDALLDLLASLPARCIQREAGGLDDVAQSPMVNA